MTDNSRVVFGGDTYLGERPVRAGTTLRRRLADAELVCVNLEGPALEKGGFCDREPETPLYSHPGIVDLLADLNASVVSAANNHITDWGESGLRETLDRLGRRGIAAFGVGENLEVAAAPQVRMLRGGRVGLLAFGDEDIGCKPADERTSGCAPMSEDLMRRSIERLSRDVDVVVVQVHTGLTNYHLPLPSTRMLYRRLIDWGAHAVIGHHPHVMQGHEHHRGAPIFYSVGNFVFAPRLLASGRMALSRENLRSMLVELEIRSGTIVGCRHLYTLYSPGDDSVDLASPPEASSAEKAVDRWSRSLRLSERAYRCRYQAYFAARFARRLVWRLRPSRWKELNARRFRAVIAGAKRR